MPRTSVDDVVVVQVTDGIEHLANDPRGILFSEFSVLADTIK